MLANSPKEIGLIIKNQRKSLQLNQTQVGNLVGLKQKTISAAENNPASLKISTLFRILSALNLEIRITSKNENKKNSNKLNEWVEEW